MDNLEMLLTEMTDKSLFQNWPSIPTSAVRESFDLVEFQTPDEKSKNLLEVCRQWSTDLAANEKPRWLTVSGEPGCGKTLLAAKVLRVWHRHFRYFRPGMPYGTNGWTFTLPCVWVDCARLTRMDFDDRRRLLDDAEHAWLCIIDDFGAGSKSDWFMAEFFGLLNARSGGWTFITTNWRAEKIERIDKRILSRMRRDGNKLIETTLPDWRTRQ